MRILVTAGPTREYLDSVRFISNASSGIMGYSIASSGVKRGHKVILVSGPVCLPVPKGLEFVSVVSAREMYKAVMERYSLVDVVVMTAAVSDYRPANRRKFKMKKGVDRLNIEFVRNPDILAELGRRKGGRKLIGFALEDRSVRRNAERKFREKNLDAIVLNSPIAIGSEYDKVQVYIRDEGWVELPEMSKRKLGGYIIRLAERIVGERDER